MLEKERTMQMGSRVRHAGVVAMVVGAVLAGGCGQQGAVGSHAASEDDLPRGVTRVAGFDRVDTSVSAARRAYPNGAETVYLAAADAPIDALLSAQFTDGPVILVDDCELSERARWTIGGLRPHWIIGMGGPAAICQEVLEEAARIPPGDLSNQ